MVKPASPSVAAGDNFSCSRCVHFFMKNSFITFTLLTFALCSCGQSESTRPKGPEILTELPSPPGDSVFTRFSPPPGFERLPAEKGTFAGYLRCLPLLPTGSPVFLYNGNQKGKQDVHAAVVDIDTGNRDLQQCADAVMRLRAEYLYVEKRYADIRFNFTNGFPAEYSRWRQGQRISVKGNRCEWRSAESGNSESYTAFRQYLDQVFMYAGTLSLSKELKRRQPGDMEPGDVFIQGGSPGHAVIVVDMAVNRRTGEKVFVLAQSYMPAQQIHILKNLSEPGISPWYRLQPGRPLRTPEWTFEWSDLAGF